MTTASQIYDILGGRKLLRSSSPSLEELRDRVREGLPVAALEAAADRLHLDGDEISSLLLLPARTLSRRRRTGRLDPDESDRLFRLARIAARTVEILGDDEAASVWLRRPNRALGGSVPLHLLDTDAGTQRVEQVLGRIEYGVFS